MYGDYAKVFVFYAYGLTLCDRCWESPLSHIEKSQSLRMFQTLEVIKRLSVRFRVSIAYANNVR